MDYSLLLVVENSLSGQSSSISKPARFSAKNVLLDTSNSQQAIVCNQTYHIAIIDYLQHYNFDKKVENFVLTKVLRRSNDISDIPAGDY